MDHSVQLPELLLSRIADAAKELEGHQRVRVLSHYDADGISSAGVLCGALHRAGKRYQATMVKGLTDDIARSVGQGASLLIVSDMGSSNLDALEELDAKVIVLDHHSPLRDSSKIIFVNPHLAGIDGMVSASASAVCMLFAATVDEANWDLLPVAFAGIAGDRQTINGVSGLNLWLLEEGTERGIIERSPGSLLHPGKTLDGLASSTEPYLIGVSGNEAGALELLKEAGLSGNETLESLSEEQRMKLSSLLALRLSEQGTPLSSLSEVARERYRFASWNGMDAESIAGLLDACGRTGQEGLGLALALGDEEAMSQAEKLRREYRQELLAGLSQLASDGVNQETNVQWFRNERPGLSGVLSGICMSYFGDQGKPVLALSVSDGKVKASSRATFALLDQGVDLSAAMRVAASEAGGHGGGHKIASGATVPEDRQDEFIRAVDRVIGEQKAEKRSSP